MYRLLLAESNAISCGPNPTGIGLPTTELVPPDITETVLLPELAT
jgi:hypothetical protein